MGTVFSFDIRGAEKAGVPAALASAVRSLHQVDHVFSTYRPQSQVSRLARGELTLPQCDPEVAEVWRLCERAELISGGSFTASYAGSWDPTGLVKGWAVERAARLIAEAGAAAVCVNGGGDVQLYGAPERDRPWRIGVTDPLAPGGLATVVEGSGRCAVATSGPAERGCHIIDPRSGLVPADVLASMTVLCEGLTDADAWATAAYAMGNEARDWLEALPGAEAYAVTAGGTAWCTDGWNRHG
ncbi:FAD:protein FMN transferase [Streptomyces sp. SLBN-118]|uniref:FAD:protein FMN transferase n=1 Tax=Streptomyces sp. SLBN-118 TaxID=2768454 RepID=UPI001150844C|nr:FAD:protein FMN transferase [Streptomyces sp. SLBN-118]